MENVLLNFKGCLIFGNNMYICRDDTRQYMVYKKVNSNFSVSL